MTTMRTEPPTADSRRDWRDVLTSPVVLAVVALWVLLLALEVKSPFYFLHDDNADQLIGLFVHDFRVLTETGRFAEINYYQYGGEPFIEEGQTAVLFPPGYVAVALAKWVTGDVRWTIEWLVASHLTLGLVGFYAWLRLLGVSRGLAALGGLTWVLNPFVFIVSSCCVNVAFTAGYLPCIFWALERLIARPSSLSALFLGAILALFFLQGAVQWVVYSTFFLGIYFVLRLIVRTEMRHVAVAASLALAVLVFLMLITPLLLPMLHAMDASLARSKPVPVKMALLFRVFKTDLFHAQFFLFRPHLVFGVTSAILFSPALLLFPWMVFRFFCAGEETRQKLFPLLFLSPLALLLTSRWHVFLTLMPVFERFRWPFKQFIYVDFFVIAALVLSLSSLVRANRLVYFVMALVLGTTALVSLACHDGNYFSNTTLPASVVLLPPGVNLQLGRVVTLDENVPDTTSYHYFTYGHATFYGVPSLGGYNPLVGRERLQFALGIDFPNIFSKPVTPEVRAQLQNRAARYWIVEPNSPEAAAAASFPGVNLISSESDRLIFEDTQASPMVFSSTDPTTAHPFSYEGNSLFIPAAGLRRPVEISVGPTDGWWYRVDLGAWQRPDYRDNHLIVDDPALEQNPAPRILEVSYFDPRFREGLSFSLCLLIVLGLLTWLSKRAGLPIF